MSDTGQNIAVLISVAAVFAGLRNLQLLVIWGRIPKRTALDAVVNSRDHRGGACIIWYRQISVFFHWAGAPVCLAAATGGGIFWEGLRTRPPEDENAPSTAPGGHAAPEIGPGSTKRWTLRRLWRWVFIVWAAACIVGTLYMVLTHP